MTLTAPGCPVAGEMPVWVENAVASVPGVKAVTVNMVFDPPWGPEPHVRRGAGGARHVVGALDEPRPNSYLPNEMLLPGP